jgi:hypothetical protein
MIENMPQEIKLAALIDLLSEIAGRDVLSHTRHYGRDAETRIASAAVIFGRIRELLGRCESRREDNRQVWPPIWLPVRREDHSELAALYPDSTEEEIEDLVAIYFPHEEAWLRLEFAADEAGRLALHLAPLSFHVTVACNDGLVTVRDGVNDQITTPFNLFSDWLFHQISREISAALADPERYGQSLAKRIPLTERFVRVQRKQLCEVLPELKHYIVDEMTPSERREFQDIACHLKGEAVRSKPPVSGFSAADYFRCCTLCFDAAGLGDDDRGLSPRDRYQKHADGRHGGLLNLPEESSDAFFKWLSSSEWHGTHPWEIRRGGNSTHISLGAFVEGGGVRLTLAGSATTRAAETMKMALALWRAGIQFILHDADLHLRRVKGEDWIGIYPESYGLRGRYFFPTDIDITDFYPWSEYADFPQLLTKVEPLPLF